ncbi:hypothetical protein [Arthrobacter sunyaminii]|nr:hypothetical protein [Arthrobacter sunyaminii]
MAQMIMPVLAKTLEIGSAETDAESKKFPQEYGVVKEADVL